MYGNRSEDDLAYYKGLEKDPTGRYMKLKLVEKYNANRYPLKELKENGLTNVQGRCKATTQLMKYLKSTMKRVLQQRFVQGMDIKNCLTRKDMPLIG